MHVNMSACVCTCLYLCDVGHTCQLVPNAFAWPQTKRHVSQAHAHVSTCLIPHPPLRLESISIIPPSLVTLNCVQRNMHHSVLGNSIRPDLEVQPMLGGHVHAEQTCMHYIAVGTRKCQICSVNQYQGVLMHTLFLLSSLRITCTPLQHAVRPKSKLQLTHLVQYRC